MIFLSTGVLVDGSEIGAEVYAKQVAWWGALPAELK
jgi:hypothetical protein